MLKSDREWNTLFIHSFTKHSSIMWRERERERERGNQQDATNSMSIIKLISQHISGIIMTIIRRIRQCPTACGVLPGCVGCGWLWLAVVVWSCVVSCVHCVKYTARLQPQPTQPGRTPHAVVHSIILLVMGIMMPETCWDIILIVNIELVASCWFSLSLRLIFTMPGHKKLKYSSILLIIF